MDRATVTSWPGTVGDRMAFERHARSAYPTLKGRRLRRGSDVAFRYTVALDVPFYEARHVTITFRHCSATPTVTADGPTDSPHRYDDGSLCMWFPGDATANKWAFEHGLLDLLDTVRAHLFREAWWRETRDAAGAGEWLGPEVGHGPLDAHADPAEGAA